jgi:hypothetical protein
MEQAVPTFKLIDETQIVETRTELGSIGTAIARPAPGAS